MARSADDYLKMLQALLPKGRAWDRDPDSVLSNMLYAFSEELSRLETRSVDMLTETSTLYTTELIGEHEADFGIPDECVKKASTLARRRELVHTRLIAQGGQDVNYYETLATSLGRILYIVQFVPFWCGLEVAGDPCGGQKIIFYWAAVFGYHNGFVDWFEVGEECAGDPLGEMPMVSQLICMLEKHRPAQTVVLYYFYGPEFDTEFSCGFNAMPRTQTVHHSGAFAEGFDADMFDDYYPIIGAMITYWSGSFCKAFCSVETDVYKGIDLSSYFMGAFGYGFG